MYCQMTAAISSSMLMSKNKHNDIVYDVYKVKMNAYQTPCAAISSNNDGVVDVVAVAYTLEYVLACAHSAIDILETMIYSTVRQSRS